MSGVGVGVDGYIHTYNMQICVPPTPSYPLYHHLHHPQGEARAAAQFMTDPYGCRGELLEKKETRDPFATGPYADGRCPPFEELLDYCGDTVYKGTLPWDGW